MKQKNSKGEICVNGRKISEVVQELPRNFSRQKVSMGELLDCLSHRAYGIFVLILALPNLAPVPAPGLSGVLGAPLALITFQHMIGLQTPWFPEFVRKRSIKQSQLKTFCSKSAPYLKKLEHVVTPRLKFLLHFPADRLIAFACFILSLVIMMPVPFGNSLPALAICFFAIGILQKDGVCVILGIITTLVGGAAIVAFFDVLIESASKFFGF